MTLYQAHLGNSCHGFLVDSVGRIAKAAPIMSWAVGKSFDVYAFWLHRNGGWLERIYEH